MMSHEKYIQKTFQLALKGIPWARPNPLVGAVLVKEGEIIGLGYHQKYGQDHAEIDCIKNASQTHDIQGSTLYCNLEPCCHHDKQTPPCVQSIIKAGIKKVVISNLDPNPKVSGQGIEQLKAAGIEVVSNILQAEGEKLNEVYFTSIQKNRPFIIGKWAQSLDGVMATFNKNSKWISCQASRKMAHQLRREVQAILVGADTALLDNPTLNIRHDQDIDSYVPVRIIMGALEKIPLSHNIFSDQYKKNTLLFSYDHSQKWQQQIEDSGIQVVKIGKNFEENIQILLSELRKRKITSLLVEGGAKTLGQFLKMQLIDKIHIFMAPKFLGQGPKVSDHLQLTSVDQSISLDNLTIEKIGVDFHISAYPKNGLT